MTTGPCLCGDPYCPSCGDPAAARYADALDTLIDNINELDCDETEIAIFEQAGKEAVEHYRKCGGEPPI